MKKTVMGLGILLAVGITFYFGYDTYSHYMVTQFYKCIDDGNMDKALECIEKMPNVNTLEMSPPLYCVARTLTQGASMTGYLYIPSNFADLCGETKESVFLTITYLWENGAEEWHHVDTSYECTVLHEAAELGYESMIF